MILTPDKYGDFSVHELLRAAAEERAGLDHRLLAAIFDRGEAGAAADLVRFASEDHPDDRLILDDELLRMARHLAWPSLEPLLAAVARRNEFSFSDELIQAYLALGASAVEPLLKLYEEADDPGDAAFTLAALGVRDPRILTILLRELREDPAVGAIALGAYGDPAALPALEEALDSAKRDLPQDAPEIQAAIDRISNPGPREAPEPFDIWDEYPEKELPDFYSLDTKELATLLESPLAEYRGEAARVLGTRDLPRAARDRLLDLARNDADAEVRGHGWEALDAFLDEDGIGDAMLARLQNPETPPEERCGAAAGLAFRVSDPVVYQALIELYERPEFRARILRAMWHSADRRFQEYFIRHLDDGNAEIRNQALWGCGWFGMAAYLSRIEKYFDDEESRATALHAYAMAAPGEASPFRMRSIMKKIEDLAGGLDEDEAELVEAALDERLERAGMAPVFHASAEDQRLDWDERPPAPIVAAAKTGRNDPCPCGSGKKFKKCCGK